MGSEGLRILEKSKGASSSSHSAYDDRVTLLEKLLEERETEARRRDEEAQIRDKEARRTRERLEEMERQMRVFNTTYRPSMHIQHPEMTPQIPFTGNMGSMGSRGFANYSHISNNFPYGYYDDTPLSTPGAQAYRGSSRAGSRGGSRGSHRGGSRGHGRQPDHREEPNDDDDDYDDH
ncbi:unnamed protein product [Cuscuta europaea]|uniref:Uncharacterized protein n=1 Tax=Cuscuta europaea TaxID=41803 RepID=A0A9P0YGV1_CUSEU|nr:unnamed protein product [Cuscuta europaea]